MANIDKETDGTYDYQMQQYDGPGRGLFQLDPGGDHVNQYNMFLDRNKRQDSMEAQLDYYRNISINSLSEVFQRLIMSLRNRPIYDKSWPNNSELYDILYHYNIF